MFRVLISVGDKHETCALQTMNNEEAQKIKQIWESSNPNQGTSLSQFGCFDQNAFNWKNNIPNKPVTLPAFNDLKQSPQTPLTANLGKNDSPKSKPMKVLCQIYLLADVIIDFLIRMINFVLIVL